MNSTINEIEELVHNDVRSVVDNYDVVVVGAGPTGLILANSLYQQGVRCKIFDARSEIAKFDSKCTTTHIRVLEIFEQLGVLDELEFEENLVKGLIFKNRYQKQWKSFLSILTDFSESEGVFWEYALSTPQWKLEIALLAALQNKGGDVDYDVKLLDFEQDEEGVTATLYDSIQDKKFPIRCKYLVGCDGVKSTVREKLQIPRVGSPYKEFFIIADVHLKNFNYALDRRYTFSCDRYHMHFAHLGDNLFRVFITYYEEFVNETHHQLWVGNCQEEPEASQKTLKWFQQQVNQLGLNFELYDPVRFSSYKVFLGYAKESRKGRVFLAGDAAHSHTPHGGQGMNTGVMDGHNLGWKLAHTVLGITNPIVLDSYVDEREPVWHQLVKRTDFIKDVVERRKFSIRFLTDFILPVLPKSVLQKFGKTTSMLTLNYRQSPISQDHYRKNLLDYLPSHSRKIYSGDRAPDSYVQMITSQGLSVQGRLHHLLFGDRRLGNYSILYFNPQDHTLSDYENFQELATKCQNYFKVKTAWFYVIPEGSSLVATTVPILLDIDNLSFKRYGLKTKTLYLIRPDGYVAYLNQPFNPEKVMAYFQDIFLPA
jgi:2-polyprenyl-6-methoxyphenol hydroxylase-like FAD-dependent oxidoreductase